MPPQPIPQAIAPSLGTGSPGARASNTGQASGSGSFADALARENRLARDERQRIERAEAAATAASRASPQNAKPTAQSEAPGQQSRKLASARPGADQAVNAVPRHPSADGTSRASTAGHPNPAAAKPGVSQTTSSAPASDDEAGLPDQVAGAGEDDATDATGGQSASAEATDDTIQAVTPPLPEPTNAGPATALIAGENASSAGATETALTAAGDEASARAATGTAHESLGAMAEPSQEAPDAAAGGSTANQSATPAAAVPQPAQSAAQADSAGRAPAPAAPQSPPSPPTLQVAVTLLRATAGLEQQVFSMQLRPEKLGSVDVRLELDKHGRASATFTAEHPETLTLLQRDAHHLVASLKQAGVDADPSSLSFSLKDTRQDQPGFGQNKSTGSRAIAGKVGATATTSAVAPTIARNRLYDIHA